MVFDHSTIRPFDHPTIRLQLSLSTLSTSPFDDGIIVVVHYFYILRCADKSLYIGQAADIEERVHTHNLGRDPAFTRVRRPVVLAYSEIHEDRAAAMHRERQVKHWKRAKKEALVAGDLAQLKKL